MVWVGRRPKPGIPIGQSGGGGEQGARQPVSVERAVPAGRGSLLAVESCHSEGLG